MRTLRRPGLGLISFCVVLMVASTAACSSDDDTTASSTTVSTDPSTAGTDATSAGGDPTLGPDMVRFEGTVTGGRADAATDGEIGGPFTLQVPSRGGGNGAVLNPVSVDGVSSSVVWDGGRTLTLDGPPLHFDGGWALEGGVMTFDLTTAAVPLPPGSYSLVGPVAVGTPDGLASPADRVSFVAGAGATIVGTGTSSVSAAGEITLLGPGSLDLSGAFTMTTTDGSTSAQTLHLEEGSFEMTLSPSSGSLHVTGIAQGAGWA